MKGIRYLPPKAFIVLVQDEDIVSKTASGLFLGEKSIKKDTGTIVAISEDKKEFLNMKVKFRENFGEEVELNGNKYLYFRDFDTSIWYVIEDV